MSRCEVLNPSYAKMLAALHAQCFDEAWTEKSFADFLALPTTKGFVNDAGFILCCVTGDEAEILTLCVIPSARRQGRADELLFEMENMLSVMGIKAFLLDVKDTNTAAKKLYHKHGFFPVSRRKAYYADGTDAIILRKVL